MDITTYVMDSDFKHRAEELAEESFLSEVESQIVLLLKEGYGRQKIAEELDIPDAQLDTRLYHRLPTKIEKCARTAEALEGVDLYDRKED